MFSKSKLLLASLAIIGQAATLEYAESEGPTKVDLGENDDPVLERADDSSAPGAAAWKKDNPLGWTDDGEDDDVVVTMVDGSLVSTNAL